MIITTRNTVGFDIVVVGDSAITVEFSEDFRDDCGRLAKMLDQSRPDGLIALIQTEPALTLIYDPSLLTYGAIKRHVLKCMKVIRTGGNANEDN